MGLGQDDAREAVWALEDALIRRFGALPRGDADVAVRTDNALVYAECCRDRLVPLRDRGAPSFFMMATIRASVKGSLLRESPWPLCGEFTVPT